MDMWILVYAVYLRYWGVIFKLFGKIKFYFKCIREFVIIRNLVRNTSLKWNILIYFLSCDFLYCYLKLGANVLDGTLKYMKKQRLVQRRKPTGFLPNGLVLPWRCYHIPESDLETAGAEILICHHYKTRSQEHYLCSKNFCSKSEYQLIYSYWAILLTYELQ